MRVVRVQPGSQNKWPGPLIPPTRCYAVMHQPLLNFDEGKSLFVAPWQQVASGVRDKSAFSCETRQGNGGTRQSDLSRVVRSPLMHAFRMKARQDNVQ